MAGGTCPINLGPRQKRARLLLGIGAFLAAGALLTVLVLSGEPPISRISAFPLFLISMLGFFQAKQKTCVIFAFQGVQDLGNGVQPAAASDTSFLHRAAARIVLLALLAAALLTAICIIL